MVQSSEINDLSSEMFQISCLFMSDEQSVTLIRFIFKRRNLFCMFGITL